MGPASNCISGRDSRVTVSYLTSEYVTVYEYALMIPLVYPYLTAWMVSVLSTYCPSSSVVRTVHDLEPVVDGTVTENVVPEMLPATPAGEDSTEYVRAESEDALSVCDTDVPMALYPSDRFWVHDGGCDTNILNVRVVI
jgi:hypothetical protein